MSCEAQHTGEGERKEPTEDCNQVGNILTK